MTDEKCPYEVGKLYPARDRGKREFIGLNRHNKKYPFIFCNIEDGDVYIHGVDGCYFYSVDEHPFDIISTTPIREPRRNTVWGAFYDEGGLARVSICYERDTIMRCIDILEGNSVITNISKPFQVEIVEPEESVP